jgi:hypothetical protein
MWDSWYRDYQNDQILPYDALINSVSKMRLAATEYQDKFDLVPFYGQYTTPEVIRIYDNVRWNPQTGVNDYDLHYKTVNIKFDKSQADTDREIQYYADNNFDFFCFNYYNYDSPLSEARLQFVASNNKRGMKMTFMLAAERNSDEINYITDLMLKDYWFRIGGKPVLYVQSEHFSDISRYRSAYASKGGGEIYFVYFEGGNYPWNFENYNKFGLKAASSYTLFMSENRRYGQDEFGLAEINARDSWMNQFKATGLQLIPTLTIGFENLAKKTSLDNYVNYSVDGATIQQIDNKLKLIKPFISSNTSSVPALLFYSGNEIIEGGESIVPKRKKDGTIDDSIIRAIGKHLR